MDALEAARKVLAARGTPDFAICALNNAEAIARALLAHPKQQEMTRIKLTDAQIKHMVDRFLSWKLPTDFSPDCGISFDPVGNKGAKYEFRREPSGTNLFDATQADAMVRYMAEGMPGPAEPTRDTGHVVWAAGYSCGIVAAADLLDTSRDPDAQAWAEKIRRLPLPPQGQTP